MALITDAANTWSAPVTLTTDEIWQAREGSVFITTDPNAGAEDGLALQENSAVQLPAGTELRYRKEGVVSARIAREAI